MRIEERTGFIKFKQSRGPAVRLHEKKKSMDIKDSEKRSTSGSIIFERFNDDQ